MKDIYIGLGLIASLILLIVLPVSLAIYFTPEYHTAHIKTYYRQLPAEETTKKRCSMVGSSVNLTGGCGYGVHVTPTGIKMGFSYF